MQNPVCYQRTKTCDREEDASQKKLHLCPASMEESPGQCKVRRSALLAFCFPGLVWGANFIFVKWAAAHITPVRISLLRVTFGLLLGGL
jgi:hypothetical protein